MPGARTHPSRRSKRSQPVQTDRLGAKWAELDTGHYPMLSTPTELTALLTAG
jgi:hypothetical protein